MSTRAVYLSLCTLAAAACGHHPAPETAAVADRDSVPCPQPDSGIALGHDVSRGPRYRVDSAGKVETLPPVPTVKGDTASGDTATAGKATADSATLDSAPARSDSATRPCRAIPDTTADTARSRAGTTPQ